MMDSLKDLNDKIKNELHLNEEDKEYGEEFMDDIDSEELDAEMEADAEEEEVRKDSRARIRVETESKIRGIIKNLDFEVNFRDLADRINDEIDGVVLTREKSHQLFNIIRDFLGF
jgi:hypothetical protein